MAYVHQTPIGMRKPKRKGGSAGPNQGRAKTWYEVSCPCGARRRTAIGQKSVVCTKCNKAIPGPWG